MINGNFTANEYIKSFIYCSIRHRVDITFVFIHKMHLKLDVERDGDDDDADIGEKEEQNVPMRNTRTSLTTTLFD